MIKFLTGNKKPIATRIGADFFSQNISNLPELTSLAASLGLHSYFYCDLSGTINDSQATQINTFLNATGAKIGVYIPIRLSNYMEYLDWAISVFGSKIDFLQLDQENTHLDNDEYIARCKQCMDKYPSLIFSWNCGLISKDDKLSKAINALIAQQTGSIYGRQYEHLIDGCTFGNDQQVNYTQVQNYYSTYLPNIQTGFKTECPNLSKQVILQWQESDNLTILNDVVTNLAIGEMGIFTLTNTQNYSHLFRQSITNLIVNGTETEKYKSIKRIVPAFKYKNSIPIELPFEGTAVGVSDGKNSFGLLISIPPSATEQTITPSDIKIGKKKVVGGFINDCGYSDTFDGEIQNSVFTLTDIPVKKGVNFITFTAQ